MDYFPHIILGIWVYVDSDIFMKKVFVFRERKLNLICYSSSSEDDDLDIEEEENEELVFKSDHEFSPESDVGEEDAAPIKRARTAVKGQQLGLLLTPSFSKSVCELWLVGCGEKL